MKYDDKKRSENGIVISLRDMGNGKSRLFFDDVKADKENNPISWEFECFYTFSGELENNDLNNMKLSAEQFQRFGMAVVARLLAINGRLKN